jgi:hypothetical protein
MEQDIYIFLGIIFTMIPKEYRLPIIGLMFAGILWMTSLYQLEICLIWVSQGKFTFEFPLFIFTTSVWMARDVWYVVNALSLIVAVYSGAIFNGKRMEMRMKNVKPTS